MTAPIPQSVDTLGSGRTSTGPFITVIKNRAPTGNDGINQSFQIGQRWIDTSSGNAEYFLLNFIAAAGVVQAHWILLVSGTSTVETLTGNSGTAVTPDVFNNINVVGDGMTGLLFDGASHTLTGTLNDIPNSALANDDITLIAGTGISITVSPVALGGSTTISASAAVPTTFTENAGSATPSANNLNILGIGGITTSGAGSTVTIDGSGVGSTLDFDTDSGTATPVANTITIAGGLGITTSGAGSTVTIDAGITVPTSFTSDAGVATPAANNLNAFGAGGITTSGAGSTLTINGAGILSNLIFDADSGTANPAADVIIFTGTSGITTSGSGNTVTISGTGIAGLSSLATQIFTSSGTYTPHASMQFCIIEVCGGGGGGAGALACAATTISIGGGGGGGGYARSLALASDIGASKTVTIGAAGTAGGSGSNGGDGGTTSVGSLISATGGKGGWAAGVGPSGQAHGGNGGIGSSSLSNPLLIQGTSGGYGFGTNNTSFGGQGGNSYFGGGSGSVVGAGSGANTPGKAGGNYGGGGGGASTETGGGGLSGGAGAKGVVFITEYI